MKQADPKEIIKQAREKKGLTQAQLAENLDISGRMIQRYEEGKFPKFKSENIAKLDEYLGTNICDILYDIKNDNRPVNEEMYERLIDQIEARRADSEAMARKMEAHYNDMKNALERAQVTINEVLKPIKEQTAEILTSSKKVDEGLLSLKTEVAAENGEIMATLDQIAGNEIGTTAARAGTVEIGHRIEKAQKGKKANIGKQD